MTMTMAGRVGGGPGTWNIYACMYMVIYVSTSPQTTAVHTSHKLSTTIITFIYIRNKSIYIHKKLANDLFFQKQYFHRLSQGPTGCK